MMNNQAYIEGFIEKCSEFEDEALINWGLPETLGTLLGTGVGGGLGYYFDPLESPVASTLLGAGAGAGAGLGTTYAGKSIGRYINNAHFHRKLWREAMERTKREIDEQRQRSDDWGGSTNSGSVGPLDYEWELRSRKR